MAPSTCICGQKHAYKNCFNINPAKRPVGWVVKRAVINRINGNLDADADLRKNILDLGYEHYRAGVSNIAKMPSDNPILDNVQPGAPQVSSAVQRTSPKKPVNPDLEFQNLPIEILEKIVEYTYELTLDELPSSHPVVTNQPADWSPAAVKARERRRNPPAQTVLRNSKPPTSYVNPKGRKAWLWKNPGQWGPIFKIMFVSKLFYEIAKPIRYREIHLGNLSLNRPSLELMCNRLVVTRVIQDFTKHVFLTYSFGDEEERIIDLTKALQTLSHLKHVCVTIKDSSVSNVRSLWAARGCSELLHLFDLEIETLTFIWSWGGLQQYLDIPHDPNADEEYAPVPSKAESLMQTFREHWMTQTFKKSSWYRDPKDTESSLQDKPKHTHDWTATGKGLEFLQWEMDRFTFSPKISPCPSWNLRENPRNHPDQLRAEEVKASRPLLEWRKGFRPY